VCVCACAFARVRVRVCVCACARVHVCVCAFACVRLRVRLGSLQLLRSSAVCPGFMCGYLRAAWKNAHSRHLRLNLFGEPQTTVTRTKQFKSGCIQNLPSSGLASRSRRRVRYQKLLQTLQLLRDCSGGACPQFLHTGGF